MLSSHKNEGNKCNENAQVKLKILIILMRGGNYITRQLLKKGNS